MEEGDTTTIHYYLQRVCALVLALLLVVCACSKRGWSSALQHASVEQRMYSTKYYYA